MNDLVITIQKILQSYVDAAMKEVALLVHDINPEATVRSGSWANQNIAVAYISILGTASQTDDSIDSMIQLKISGSIADFQLDVAKSSGQLIFEIWNEQISYANNEQLQLIINNLCRKTIPLLIEQLKNRLPDVFRDT